MDLHLDVCECAAARLGLVDGGLAFFAVDGTTLGAAVRS